MTAAADVTRRSPRRVFRDRREAGRVLAELLAAYRDQPDVIVLGLARGGLPVAWEVAAALHAPLDAFVVRKLGAPGHDEFAVGALASGGRVVVNDDVVRGLRITPQQLRDIAEREGRELLRRESAYRGERPPTDITGKTVIVVDDGLATGASMFAAVQALRDAQPAQPAADNVTAVAAAQVSARHQARRRRRAAAKERGNADEFVDMDSGPAIPPSGERDAWASNSGVGGLGFAGTASNETVAAPAGLTTLADDEFQCGPRMPMLPGAWDLGTWDRGD